MKKQQGYHHKHSLGQNFITDDALFEQLVDAAGVGESDTVLEIGAGAGGMTAVLGRRCKQVVALEIDHDLIPILRVTLLRYPNVTLVEGDVMRVNLPQITAGLGAFHVVANIPYYLTTDLMVMLLSSKLPILSINVMVQKEAAERILATPGGKEYGMLAVRSQLYTTPRIALDVPAACFTPPPKVDSAFVVMPKRDCSGDIACDDAMTLRVATAAFAMRRKTLLNNLMTAFAVSREVAQQWLTACGVPLAARGETLPLSKFMELAAWKENNK